MSNQLSQNLTDLGILQHPLFSLRNDEVFSFLLEPFDALLEPQKGPQDKKILCTNDWLISKIFDDKPMSQIEEKFQGLNLVRKTLCGRVIEKKGIYLWCIDCEIPGKSNIFILLCSDCYDKGNHEGHRVIMIQNGDDDTRTCDCGDEYFMKAENSCPEHQPCNVDIKDLLNKFPQDTRERCNAILPKVFYTIVALFEIAKAAKNQEMKLKIHELAQKLSDDVFSFLLMCYTKLNGAFLVVFGTIFLELFQPPYNNVFHTCEDLKEEDLSSFGEHAHACKCTILGNLLRLGNTFGENQQATLCKILLECSKEDSFQDAACLEFVKYNFFLYGKDYGRANYEDGINSKLLNVIPKFFIREDLRLKVLDSGYFPNLLEVLRYATYNCTKISWGFCHIAESVQYLLFCFLDPNFTSTARILKETDFLQQLLHLIGVFQSKLFYEKDIHASIQDINGIYGRLNCGFWIERMFCYVVENSINIICSYPDPTKSSLIKNFLTKWHEDFQTTSVNVNKEFANLSVTFHLGVERMFCYAISKYLQINSLKGIEDLIQEAIPHTQINKLSEDILPKALRVLGLMAYLRIIEDDFYRQLNNVYNLIFGLFEADVVLVQIMSSMYDSNALFEAFIDNFFYYDQEVQDFFRGLKPINKDNKFKKRLSAINDFLNFLIFIMNDELSLLNLTVPKQKSYVKGENARFEAVVQKALINILLGNYWTDFEFLKRMRKGVLKEEHEFETILSKIAIVDQKTHKIRIRDEYNSDFDPYMFYRKPSIQADLLSSFSSKVKKDKQVDLVSGKYYKDLPEYLKATQKNLYQSKLTAFLSLFVIKMPDEAINSTRPVLKLILLNLQVAEEALNIKDSSAKALMEKIKAYYLVPEFLDGLNKISKRDELEDCRLCVEKIEDLLNVLSARAGQEISSPTKENSSQKEDQEKSKEKLAKERMQKLKEEFAKKQALFASKNAEAQQQDNMEETKVEEVQATEECVTCQHCLEEIHRSSGLYGVPIYITFTNNMYNMEEGKVSTGKDQDAERWWPVISSCNHFYHKKCFEAVNKNSRAPHDPARTLLNNLYETYCPLCKTCCNYFVCVNIGDVNDTQVKGSKESNQNQSEVYTSLSKAIELIFASTMAGFELNPYIKTQKTVLCVAEDIFKRAYSYFLEGFHINTQPKSLEKSFRLYQNFFKEFLIDLEANTEPEKLERGSTSFSESIIDLHGGQKALTDETLLKSKSIELRTQEYETVLNKIFFNILEETVTSKGLNEGSLQEKQLSVLKDYLIFKITQYLSFQKEYKVCNVNDLKELYKSNKELFYSIIKQFIFPIEKIVLASCMNRSILSNQSIVSDDFWALLCLSEKNNDDYIESMLRLLDPSLILNKLLENIFNELESQNKLNILLLDTMLMYSSEEIEIKLPKVVKLSPRMINLPANYGDFVNKYVKAKCSLCKNFSKRLNSTICLICDAVICEFACDSSNPPLGNLNMHAQTCHMGLGLFFEVHYLRVLSISSPLNSIIITTKQCYLNGFGQSADIVINDLRKTTSGGGAVDFKSFTLNEEFVESVKSVIYHHDMGKEAFKKESSNNRRFQPGVM